jgi:hypothetical protein
MVDRYTYYRTRVLAKIQEFNTGTVTLTRTTNAAPEADTPWIPGAPTTEVYSLDAVVHEVSEQYVDNTLIVASDLMVVAPSEATLDGTVVAFEPHMGDVVTIDGVARAIKRILPSPAAGDAAIFRIFVGSGG